MLLGCRELQVLSKVVRLEASGCFGVDDFNAPAIDHLQAVRLTRHRHYGAPSRVYANADGTLLHLQKAPRGPSEDLTIVNRSFDFLETQSQVSALRHVVVNL